MKATFLTWAVFSALSIVVLAGCSDQPNESDSAANVGIKSPTSAAGSTTQSRAVLKSGSISLRVQDLRKSETEIVTASQKFGGFVEHLGSSNLASSQPSMTLTIRVPVDHFDEAMKVIEKQGYRLAKSVESTDVTTELADQRARHATLIASSKELLRLYNSAPLNDKPGLLERRMAVEEQLQTMQGQLKSKGRTAAMSTIEVYLVSRAIPYSETEDSAWLSETWNSASSSFAGTAKALGSLAIYGILYSPFWAIPVVAIVAYNRKKLKTSAKPSFEL